MWDDATIDWYVREHGNAPILNALVSAANVPTDATVVDFGCGPGAALRLLAASGQRKLIGIEPFERMLHHARRQTQEARLRADISFLLAPVDNIPLEPRFVDVVLAFNLLPHLDQQAPMFREASRLLKDGGQLLIGGDEIGGPERDGRLSNQLQDAGFAPIERIDVEEGLLVRAEKQASPDLTEVLARYPGAETFCFGDNRMLCDQLLDLVRRGKKTATCAAASDYDSGGWAIPEIGRRDIALDWDGRPAFVIETTALTRQRYCDVDADFALAEGENDSLEEWRRHHRIYFERNGGWSSDMMLVCERFRLVEDLASDV